jgi:3-hydroxy acid dehydrogenase/malonic semialdehyde reductase
MSSYLPSTVFITGATSGFGIAMAERFAALGSRLVLAGRRVERLQALAARLAPTLVHPVAFDIRDAAATVAALDGLPDAFTGIDLLINNAGLALGTEPAQAALLADWEVMIETNTRGLVTITRLVLPGMIARGRGHIINIGSVAGSYPYAGGNVYCATKAFVKQFTLALRGDLLGTGVRVTNIEPGMVAGTEFSLVRYHGDAKKAAGVYAGTTPLTPDDVAESVVWCATLPPRVNINRIELMPATQAPGPTTIYRQPIG